MIQDILLAFWFLLPAAAANAIPVFVAKIPVLDKFDAPIDGGRKIGKHDILGSHKTWRGLIAGIIIATLVLWLQQFLVVTTDWFDFFTEPVNYATLPVLLLGPAFAIGALGGDAIESFFKRRFSIKSGRAWVPFDQVDYIIGSILMSLFFVVLTPLHYALMLVIWFVVHIASTIIGYKLGLKKDPI